MTGGLPRWIFLLNLASTLPLCGLIWFVQVVHYPLFANVGPDGFAIYEARHAAGTTTIVAPLMLAEALSTGVLVALRPELMSRRLAVLGLALVIAVWLSTFLVQVPLHNILAAGFDPDTHSRLVAGNWFRTAAWSARALLLLYCLKGSIR
jgi:hypothetical protein